MQQEIPLKKYLPQKLESSYQGNFDVKNLQMLFWKESGICLAMQNYRAWLHQKHVSSSPATDDFPFLSSVRVK